MKKKFIIIVAVLVFPLLVFGSIMISRHRANARADAIMRPIFELGWYRGKTQPVLWLGGEWQPSWYIQYEMDHPTAIVDFGPQFLISWSGEIMMSPADLEERISQNIEAVDQTKSTAPSDAGPSASPQAR